MKRAVLSFVSPQKININSVFLEFALQEIRRRLLAFPYLSCRIQNGHILK